MQTTMQGKGSTTQKVTGLEEAGEYVNFFDKMNRMLGSVGVKEGPHCPLLIAETGRAVAVNNCSSLQNVFLPLSF
jgi:hypothetical protein